MKENWHYASSPNTAARSYEEAGQEAAYACFSDTTHLAELGEETTSAQGGTPESRLKYFIVGFNSMAAHHGFADYQITRYERARVASKLPFWERMNFKYRRLRVKHPWLPRWKSRSGLV